MSTSTLVALDSFGVLEVVDQGLLETVAAGRYVAGSDSSSHSNGHCVNDTCGAEVNNSCYGSNTGCVANANTVCGANVICTEGGD